MDVQSEINFAGAVLPVLAALVPGLAQAEGAFTVVEDGIKVEQAIVTYLGTPAGLSLRADLTQLFGHLGINLNFGGDGHIGASNVDGVAPADWSSPVWKSQDPSPYA